MGTDGWIVVIFSNSHFVIGGRGPSAKRGLGWGSRAKARQKRAPAHTLPTQTGMQIPSPSQNAPPGIICEQKCSRQAVSASVLSLFATPASPRPAESPSYLFAMVAEANGEHNGPIGPGQARLSFWPHTTSPFHLHHLQDPGALNKEVASSAGRRGSAWEGGNIGLWRKSPTPFPLLSLSLRPDGLQSHILKEKQKTKTQRLTCLKSMKANCSVSPWNPGTGPDLANSVGKKRG